MGGKGGSLEQLERIPVTWPDRAKAQRWGHGGLQMPAAPRLQEGSRGLGPLPAPWVVLMDFCFSFACEQCVS